MSDHSPYIRPAYGETAFNCPYCKVYTEQFWSNWSKDYDSVRNILGDTYQEQVHEVPSPVNITISKCSYCNRTCLWLNEILTVPDYNSVHPNDDMSKEIKNIYREAASIFQKSPRAAAALLRLALQMLCKQQLGGKGENIYDDIQQFIEEGKVSDQVMESMDAVRLIGNEAVHPGMIDFNDNPDIANVLFELINFIANETLTKPKERQQKLDKLKALTDKNSKQKD